MPKGGVSDMPLKQHFAEASRHPLVLTLVGFILTGILGAGLTWKLNSIANGREAERAAQARAAEAVREITDLINERRTRAILVAYAISRSSGAEVQARKASYDDVYVRWNTKTQSIALRIREMLRRSSPAEYENYFNSLTVKLSLAFDTRGVSEQARPGSVALLSKLDDCITKAFDVFRKSNFENSSPAIDVLKACRVDEIDDHIINCSSIMGDSLYALVNDLHDNEQIGKRIQKDGKLIKDACEPAGF
jgi:hypothetical protein